MSSLRFIVRASMLLALVATTGCSGVTSFRGARSIAIVGAPPPVVEVAETGPRVELRDDRIELRDNIQFDANKATIKPESLALLHEIAEVIKNSPRALKVSIE